MARLRGNQGRVLLNELQTVSDYFSQASGVGVGLGLGLDQHALEQRLGRLRDAALLLSYREHLEAAVTTLSTVCLVAPSDPDLRELGECMRLLRDVNGVKLGDTPRILERVQRHMHQLQPVHLQLLERLGQANQVIVFIQSEGSDFQVQRLCSCLPFVCLSVCLFVCLFVLLLHSTR